MMTNRQRNQPKARIGNSRHSRVGHQRDARSLLHIFHQFGGTGDFIVLVIADGAGSNAVMVQQFLRLPRIFAGDDIHFLQHAHCPESNVFQIADGRGDDI